MTISRLQKRPCVGSNLAIKFFSSDLCFVRCTALRFHSDQGFFIYAYIPTTILYYENKTVYVKQRELADNIIETFFLFYLMSFNMHKI